MRQWHSYVKANDKLYLFKVEVLFSYIKKMQREEERYRIGKKRAIPMR